MDRFAEAIGREIDRHRHKSFDNFTINAKVSPATGADEVGSTFDTFRGFKSYVLDVWGKPEKRIVHRCHSGTIQIWHIGHWMPVAEYVGLLQPQLDRETLATQAARYTHHQNWWNGNGKSFRLLDLPGEIHEAIYGYAFGRRAEPYPTHKARRQGQYGMVIKERNPNTRMLYLSKQVYQGSSHILSRDTTFFVQHRGVLSSLLSAEKEPQFSRIRQLELALSHHEFFKTFGFRFNGNFEYAPSTAAKVLRKMTLNRLELSFNPPSKNPESTLIDGACQKTVVNWILTAAWPWVRGHPVMVTGSVKTKQKAAFEASCSVERKRLEVWRKYRLAAGFTEGTLEEYDEWVKWADDDDDGGGIVLDERGRGMEMGRPPSISVVEVPPVCRCFPPCTLDTWTADG